jgi:hypothetical protein
LTVIGSFSKQNISRRLFSLFFRKKISPKACTKEKRVLIFATPYGRTPDATGHLQAGIAQLVERNLAKVEVAGSSLVSRSKMPSEMEAFFFSSFLALCPSPGGEMVDTQDLKSCDR